MCSCMHSIVKGNITTPETRDYFFVYLLPKCIGLLIGGATAWDNSDNNLLTLWDIIDDVAGVIRCIVQALTVR